MKLAFLIIAAGIAASALAAPVRNVVVETGNKCDETAFSALRPSLNAEERNTLVRQTWWVYRNSQITNIQNRTSAAIEKDRQQEAACLRLFENAVADGGNPSIVLADHLSIHDPRTVEYLLSKGANPAAKDPRTKTPYGMLAIRGLAKHNFRGDLAPADQVLSLLLPRMGNLKTLTDSDGVPLVDYALGRGGELGDCASPVPETVGLIIKRLAAAGVAVSKPYRSVMGKVSALQYYNGTDPEVIQLLTPPRR
jgi:hypothetical protein